MPTRKTSSIIRADSGHRIYVGIDPGASGGLACLRDGYRPDLQPLKGMTPKEQWHWLRWFKDEGVEQGAEVFAVIELVTGYVAGQSATVRGSTMFNFGHNAGMLHGFLVAAAIPFQLVHPRRWQKAVGSVGKVKGEKQREHKRQLKELAERLYPDVKVTLATADALLMAHYAKSIKREAGDGSED